MNLDAIGIATKNPDTSISFYERFGVSFETFGEGHFEGKTSNGMRIMLDSFELMKKINPDWNEPKSPGITLCFSQDSSTKVDQLHKQITDKGFESVKEPWDAFWGQRYASVRDPDGNQVDIYAPL